MMRSFNIVAAGVLLLVCTSLAASSVKLPNDFIVPENTELTGVSLYHTIAYSLNTLPQSAVLSRIPTLYNTGKSLIGGNAKQRATVVIVPEAIAPSGSIDAVSDNAFPVYELSRTLSSSIVLPGFATSLKNSFAPKSYHSIYTPRDMSISSLSSSLLTCGIKLNSAIEDDSFVLYDADFDVRDVHSILATAAAICSEEPNQQVNFVDFRTTYTFTVDHYGSGSVQAVAVEKMINSVIETLKGESLVYVLASDADFCENQVYDEKFVAVPPSLSATVKICTGTKVASPSTGAFQITLWFTIFVVIVIIVFALLTCGVGIDIEKDTLLYQTTCLRGQPVL